MKPKTWVLHNDTHGYFFSCKAGSAGLVVVAQRLKAWPFATRKAALAIKRKLERSGWGTWEVLPMKAPREKL